MADTRLTTAPGAPEHSTVAALHEKWRRIIRRLDTVPAVPDGKREREFASALAIERQIAGLPARCVGEIVSKLSIAKTCLSDADMALIDSAISDLHRLDLGTEIPAASA